MEGATLICGVAVHVHTSLDPEAFRAELIKALQTLRPEDVVPLAPAAPQDRYDAWVPEGLLQKAYVYNRLDIPGLKRAMFEALNGSARDRVRTPSGGKGSPRRSDRVLPRSHWAMPRRPAA